MTYMIILLEKRSLQGIRGKSGDPVLDDCFDDRLLFLDMEIREPVEIIEFVAKLDSRLERYLCC